MTTVISSLVSDHCAHRLCDPVFPPLCIASGFPVAGGRRLTGGKGTVQEAAAPAVALCRSDEVLGTRGTPRPTPPLLVLLCRPLPSAPPGVLPKGASPGLSWSGGGGRDSHPRWSCKWISLHSIRAEEGPVATATKSGGDQAALHPLLRPVSSCLLGLQDRGPHLRMPVRFPPGSRWPARLSRNVRLTPAPLAVQPLPPHPTRSAQPVQPPPPPRCQRQECHTAGATERDTEQEPRVLRGHFQWGQFSLLGLET